MTRLLLLALLLAAGCERFPTANEIDDQFGHPKAPLRRDAQTCGSGYFYRANTWTPVPDSSATCPDGRDPIAVGYAVARWMALAKRASSS